MRLFHGGDLRKGRHSELGRIYLLTTVTHGRQPVFRDFSLARCCINAMRFQHDLGRVSSLAFVVMPDHLHWLVELLEGELSGLMKSVKCQVTNRVNAASGHSGSIWQTGFHDHALRKDEDLMAAARYLVANPLRAGLVERLAEYPHWDAIWLAE
jgi:REP element-mobilizing transposase RayT